MKTSNTKESAVLKNYTIAQIILWIAFAAVMIGVGIIGYTILTTGPQILTVIGITILFILCFILGVAHGYVTWQTANWERNNHICEETVI